MKAPRAVSPVLHLVLALLPAALGALLTGCGGDGTSGPRGTAVVQLTDVPFEDLETFELQITRVLLIRESGSSVQVFPPEDSPSAAVAVDLVALQTGRQIIGIAEVPTGDFTGAELEFRDVQARAGGMSQVVDPTTGTVKVEFARRQTVRSGVLNPILLDLDGRASIISRGASSLTFQPFLFDVPSDGRLLDLEGRVVQLGPGLFQLSPGAVDLGLPPGGVEVGRVPVLMGPNTLIQRDGQVFAGPRAVPEIGLDDRAFVSGRLGASGLAAERVVLDRPGAANALRLQGSVTAHQRGAFTLRTHRVLRDDGGFLLAQDQSLVVLVTRHTVFTRGVEAVPTTFADLWVGQAVEMEGMLEGDRLTASVVDVRHTTFRGSLFDLQAPFQLGMLSTVSINGLPVEQFGSLGTVGLDLQGSRTMVDGILPVHSQVLAPGQNVLVQGFLTSGGFVQARSVFLEDVLELEATVLDIDAGARTFRVTAGSSTLRVLLDESSRLAFFPRGQGGTIVARSPEAFLRDLPGAQGSLRIRGRQVGQDVQAIVVIFERQ